jgi:single-stranded DNA-binding protein
VFFPDGSPPVNGSDERTGGFSLEVNVWGERRVAMVKLLARKGTRLRVSGRLAEARWGLPATAQERREVYVVADKLFLRIPDNAHADRRPGHEDSGSLA